MRPEQTLLFVYNASSETIPRESQLMSRPTSSLSEPCRLLTLTYSPIGMKKEWKRFLSGLKIPARFLSRDEFTSGFRNITATFPAVFLMSGKDLFIIATTEEINRCGDLNDLVVLIQQRLSGIAAIGK